LTLPAARWIALLAAAAAGGLQALSLAWPATGQPLWWLQLLSLAVLAGVLQRQPSGRAAALAGWLFATCWLAGTFWWLFISMHVYGGLASPLAAAAVLLLAGFHSH
jgi:apolipoprotein N-acyltransferase